MIYANNAGTSWPKPPEVQEAASAALKAAPQELGHVFESARETICSFLGISEVERFLFTPGCTSALSAALFDLPWNAGEILLTSALEHHAMVRPIEHLQRYGGVEHVIAPYRPGAPVDLDFVRETLECGRVRLIAATAASNVTGELLPLLDLACLAREFGALFLVDAAQTVGIVPVRVGEIGADLLVFAGHKGPLGPQGIGGLWAASHVGFEPPEAACDLRAGDGGGICAPMPGYCDVGSVNMAAAAGLAAGVRWLEAKGSLEAGSPARAFAADLAAALRERPFCTVYGGEDVERTATVSMRIDNIPLAAAEARFSELGIVVRAGQHCAPMALRAIGAPEGTIRVSFGPFHRRSDVERILEAVDQVAADV